MSVSAELAEALACAWRSGTPLTAAAARALAPADVGAAYDVQRRVATALQWFPHGRARAWKIGSPKDGAAPTAAPVPDAFVLGSPARLPVGAFHTVVGIEVELAVRFARAVAAGADRDAIAAAIGETVAAIELFDVRAEQWRTLPATFLLADQQMHARLILGSGVRGPWSDVFADALLRLDVNGRAIARQRGGHPLGDPLATLPWLANHVATHADGLQPGDWVSTGTWIALYEAQPGDRISARFDGIGTVAFDLRG
jgi:2-keto-4-pentenoate hydratase